MFRVLAFKDTFTDPPSSFIVLIVLLIVKLNPEDILEFSLALRCFNKVEECSRFHLSVLL